MKKALTDKQSRFPTEYIIDLNATQAAIRAGYSKKTAYSIGHELLKKPEIEEMIIDLKLKRTIRTEITSDRVLQELATIAFFDLKLFYDEDGMMLEIPDMPEEARRVIGGVTVTSISNKNDDNIEYYTKNIKLIDKRGSLELLGRHLAMFTDKFKIEGAESPFAQFTRELADEVKRIDAKN